MDAVEFVLDVVLEVVFSRMRDIHFLTHFGYFKETSKRCLFLNITNRSKDSEIFTTHVYLQLDSGKQIHVDYLVHKFPVQLGPGKTLETWIEEDKIPSNLGKKIYKMGRAQLSNNRIIKSKKNKKIPHEWFIPKGE